MIETTINALQNCLNTETTGVIELQNIDRQPVGAIYLDLFKKRDKIVITETNNKEKYYLFCDGLSIFFSF